MSEEPVAYWRIPEKENEESFVGFSPSGNRHFNNIPLYTKEQLQPKVKMTRAEFDEFKNLKGLTTSLFTAINLITKTNNYKRLKIASGITNGYNDIEWQNNFAYVYTNFTYDNPKETIEIVKDEKWFVRSKEKDNGVYYILGDISKYFSETTTAENDKEIVDFGHGFDTKEEAEKWVRPGEEAVLLEVEGE